MFLKNYQVGLLMVALIVVIAVVGFTTHQNWIALILVGLITVIGVLGIVRGYKRRND
jgi:hypothetical protein